MKSRRQFLKILVASIPGFGFLPTFFASAFETAKKVILPKGTKRESLVLQNPALLDTRNLDIAPSGYCGKNLK